MVPNRLPSFWCGGRAVAPSGCRLSVPRTMRALGSHAIAAMGCGGCEWRLFRRRLIDLQMRRRVLSKFRGSIPALGEADHKLLHAWAWGTEPQPISPGQLQCLPAEHIGRATSLRKTQNRPSAQAKDIATTSACSSASSDSQKRLSNSSLNTKALTQRSAHQSALRSPRSTHHHHPTRHSTWPTTPSPTY